MSRKFLGKPILAADLSTPPAIYQTFKPTNDVLLKVVRATVIQYANPSYTSIEVRIYADRNGAPGKLIASSASRTKASLFTLAHGFKNAYFTFTDVPLKANTDYHAVMWINGAYIGSDASHIAWAHIWPDAIYETGVTSLQTKAAKFPFDVAFIAARI